MLSLSFGIIASQGFAQKARVQTLVHDNTFELKPLDELNSNLRETNISITPDGKHLFFMSDRGGQSWSEKSGKYKGKSRYDGDLWYANRKGDDWQAPICMDSTINTNSGEDEPIISPDGQYVVFQSWKDDWKQTGGPYYIAELHGNKWSNPVGLGGGINKFFIGRFNRSQIGYATDGATLSPDGTIFIVACAEDYEGEMDLYMSKKLDGSWGPMRKMSLSTAGDERSVFMAGDGRTVYFASDGYEGFGGLDVFKTVMNEDGTFGEVMNIGKPFNTMLDDYGFIIAATGEEGFFVRNGDIYEVSIDKANPQLKPVPTLLITGRVMDRQGNYIEAHLNLIDADKKKIIARSRSNSKTGNYSFSTPQRAATYQIIDNDRVYVDTTFHVEHANVYQELNIELKSKDIKQEIALPKERTFRLAVNFDFNSSELRDEDKNKLETIFGIIEAASAYEIEIAGHTDSKGSTVYNDSLALSRAEALKVYFLQKGLNEEDMSITAHGENQPISDNETERGRDINRRTEVIIKYY